jgi:hypothetical protein
MEQGIQEPEKRAPPAQLPVIRPAVRCPPPEMPAALALATEPARERVARPTETLPAGWLPRPPALVDLVRDSCLHPHQASASHRFPAAPAAAELARLLKVWGSSRFPATAPHRERGSARRAAWLLPRLVRRHDVPPHIPDRNKARKRATDRRRSPAARPCQGSARCHLRERARHYARS